MKILYSAEFEDDDGGRFIVELRSKLDSDTFDGFHSVRRQLLNKAEKANPTANFVMMRRWWRTDVGDQDSVRII